MNHQVTPVSPANNPTRRQAILGVAMTIGGLALSTSEASAQTSPEVSHTAEGIHQEPFFKADPKRVYEVLTNAKLFDRVVQLSAAMKSNSLGNKPTQITNQEGGTFLLFGGHILGRQLELIPPKRIVEAWRVESWDPGIYSIVRFELVEQASGTKIVFDHTGFPQGLGQHLADGWKMNYWEPLEKVLAQTS
jgi:activator of HSP90 ATPase